MSCVYNKQTIWNERIQIELNTFREKTSKGSKNKVNNEIKERECVVEM
jgi:hypothetical protein